MIGSSQIFLSFYGPSSLLIALPFPVQWCSYAAEIGHPSLNTQFGFPFISISSLTFKGGRLERL